MSGKPKPNAESKLSELTFMPEQTDEFRRYEPSSGLPKSKGYDVWQAQRILNAITRPSR